MEQTLPSRKDTLPLGLTEKSVEIAKVLVHYNQLTSYPYSDLQIAEWAKSIEELIPSMTLETLKTIIDRMKMGIYDFDSRLGIQNIFSGARQFIKDEIDAHQKIIAEIRKKMYYEYEEVLTEEERTLLHETEEKIKKLQNNLFKISPKQQQYEIHY